MSPIMMELWSCDRYDSNSSCHLSLIFGVNMSAQRDGWQQWEGWWWRVDGETGWWQRAERTDPQRKSLHEMTDELKEQIRCLQRDVINLKFRLDKRRRVAKKKRTSTKSSSTSRSSPKAQSLSTKPCGFIKVEQPYGWANGEKWHIFSREN